MEDKGFLTEYGGLPNSTTTPNCSVNKQQRRGPMLNYKRPEKGNRQ
jgi:hypothetical protein